MITATFKNGTTAEYKGKRKVSYAWLLTWENGDTEIGFSNSEKSARGTARDRIRQLYKTAYEFSTAGKYGRQPHVVAYVSRKAKENGFKTLREWQAHCQKRNAQEEAKHTIEIVKIK